jgi:outer membrane protein assembly factor BamB
MRRLVTVLALLVASLAVPGTAEAAAGDWTQYHGDARHSGYAPSVKPPGPLRKAWAKTLDGPVYASPIVVEGTVVVATENNSIYGFTRSGALRWVHHDLRPVPLKDLPCGNINPVGITGTPVFDPSSHRVYAVITTPSAGSTRHHLIGVDVRNGRLVSRRSVDVPGQDPRVENQRGALGLTRGRVLVTYGGHFGDCGAFRGYLLEVPTDGSAIRTFRSGDDTEAGMWQPSGPTVGPDGSVYVVSGNGSRFSGAWDGGNAVHRIDPVTARRLSFYAPSDWAQGNRDDADLGSTGATSIGSRVWIQGKTSTGYLLDYRNLGGIGHPLATVTGACARQFGGSAVHDLSAYLPCTDGIRKITVSGTKVTLGWKAPSNVTGSPVVGGGCVWSLDPSAGVLYALDERTGKVRTKLSVGTTTRFSTPALSGSLAFISTARGIVAVANV